MTLSIRADRPVDVVTLAILRGVATSAQELRLSYFVVGATARDLLLTNVYGINTGLATRDIDFALAVRSWAEFEGVRSRLANIEGFSLASNGAPHRITYKHKNGTTYPLDLLPFRGVEDENSLISWPPDLKVMMSVLGYEEALASAVDVQIDSEIRVPVASLAGLAILKLIAWVDRGSETTKDALDLASLLRNYAAAGNMDRVYGEDIAALERVGYDINLVSPHLLGMDVRRISSPLIRAKVKEILNHQTSRERLALHMSKQYSHAADPLAAAEESLEQFQLGLAD